MPLSKVRAKPREGGKPFYAESFDHLVRSPAAFDKFRLTIAENPLKAKLRPGEFIHPKEWRLPETDRKAIFRI